MGSEKSTEPVPVGAELAESTDLAFMGTIVSAGEGTGVVYATGRECCRIHRRASRFSHAGALPERAGAKTLS